MRVERVQWDGSDAPALAARLRSLAPPMAEVSPDVATILERVRAGGDAAVRDISAGYGELVPESLRVDPEVVAAAPGLLEPEVREALRAVARNVAVVARAELDAGRPAMVQLEDGQTVEVREEPVAAAGVYTPGGRATYPSSVLMCCVPARVAGVGRIAVASPPGAAGRPDPTVLAACSLLGVEEVYAMGGAQAIAALAFGTETVAPVDVIAGPGSRYVAEAKRQLAGLVGIDGMAGPTELMIVADGNASPRWMALDLCAQAEHGEDGLLILASANEVFVDQVAELVDELRLGRPSIKDAPLALVLSPGLEVALTLADAVAPEHLELAFEGADETIARARVAGCVFIGDGGGAAFGDYAAGSNHVLPTGGAARFSGPLGPGAFRRRMSVVSLPGSTAAELAPHVGALARAEGFPVHAESAEARR
jgi:histidinol dehydrogenase